MAINNSINLNQVGVIGCDGSGSFYGSQTVPHSVLVGGSTSSTLTNVTVGTTNTVLLGNTAANPSFGKVSNEALVNSSITVNTTGSITGGGTVALGGTLNLNVPIVSSSWLRTFATMGA